MHLSVRHTKAPANCSCLIICISSPDLWQKCLRQSQQLGLKVLSKQTKWMFVKACYAKHLPPSSLNSSLVQRGGGFFSCGHFFFLFFWLAPKLCRGSDSLGKGSDNLDRTRKRCSSDFWSLHLLQIVRHRECVHNCDSVNLKGIFSSLSGRLPFKLSMTQNNVMHNTWNKALCSHKFIDFMFPALSLRLI